MVSREDIGKRVKTPGGAGIFRDIVKEGEKERAIVEFDFSYLVTYPLEEVDPLEEGEG
jgi:hypothetical protein